VAANDPAMAAILGATVRGESRIVATNEWAKWILI